MTDITRNLLKFLLVIGLAVTVLTAGVLVQLSKYLHTHPPMVSTPEMFAKGEGSCSVPPCIGEHWVLKDSDWTTKHSFEFKDDPSSHKNLVFKNNMYIPGNRAVELSTGSTWTYTFIQPCDFDSHGKLIENHKCRYFRKKK